MTDIKKDDPVKKMASEQAVVGSDLSVGPVVDQSKEAPKIKTEAKDDDVLAEGSTSDFWKLIRKYIDAKQRRLHELTSESVRGSVNMQEVGFRYLIEDQVTHALRDIVEFVELPAKARKFEIDSEDTKGDEQDG